jgi:hypothetical protein
VVAGPLQLESRLNRTCLQASSRCRVFARHAVTITSNGDCLNSMFRPLSDARPGSSMTGSFDAANRRLPATMGEPMALSVPAGLAANCLETDSRRDWLARLPDTLGVLSERWLLTPGEPFDSDCGLVLRVTLADGTPAVLKLVMPHMEGQDEVRGMVFWDGDPTAHVLLADVELNAMLLERCSPGTSLRAEPTSSSRICFDDCGGYRRRTMGFVLLRK